MGYLRYEKRRLQTAADSAAIAGAAALQYPSTDWFTAAKNDSSANGFTDGLNNAQVNPTQVTCPDSTPNCVQVVVSQQAPTFFMRIVGISQEPLSASAVAELGNGPGCIYALGPSGIGPGTLDLDGSSTAVEAQACTLADSGDLTFGKDASSYILHTLGATYAGSYTPSDSLADPEHISPSPVQGAPPADPLAYLDTSAPQTPACGGGQPTIYTPLPNQTNTGPAPGTYACGLTINAGSAGTSTALNPGLYTVGGSGLSITGNGGSVTGNGVTFYVGGSNASVNINQGVDEEFGFGAVVQLQAPADASAGGIPGVVIFQNSSDTSAATVALAGFQTDNPLQPPPQPNSYLWGALYFPRAELTLIGMGYDVENKCSSQPRLTTVVAYQLLFRENLNFSVDDCASPASAYSFVPPLSAPLPVIKDAVLVE
jgi:hypothetical protein